MKNATLLKLVLFFVIAITGFSHAIAQPFNAIHFDGSNDNVSINNTLGNFSGDFTIEMEIRPGGDVSGIVAKRSVCANTNYYSLNAISGTLIFEIGDGVASPLNILCSGIMSDNVWHHLVITRSAGAISIYLDGTVIGTGTSTAIINNTAVLQLGASPCNNVNNPPYSGDMDEVRFWNRVLCPGELQQYRSKQLPFTSGNGLLAYYRFNQGTAGGNNAGINTLTDATGNGNNGTLNNFALTGAASNWVAGAVNTTAAAFVFPTVVATSNSPVCKGKEFHLMATAPAGSSYNWTGPTSNNWPNPNLDATANEFSIGTYKVTATLNGCSSIDSVILQLYLPPATHTAGSNSPVCARNTLTLTATTVASATYEWTGPNNFFSQLQNPSISNVSAAAAGIYKVTATVNGCESAPASVTVVVKNAPTAVVVSPSGAICTPSAAVQLVAYGGGGAAFDTIYHDGINSYNSSWTQVNLSICPGIGDPHGSDWTIQQDGYGGNWFTPDQSMFYLSESYLQGGDATATTNSSLISPAFSTVGYSDVTVDYYLAYDHLNSTAKVEASADSISWVTLKTYSVNTGFSDQFAHDSVVLAPAVLGKPKVHIRFKYEAAPQGNSWALDNVTVTGRHQVANVTWSPTTRLYTNAAATTAYTGTSTPSVYFSPAPGNYVYTATATSNGCAVMGSTSLSVNAKPLTPTASGNTPVCTGNAINLSTPTVANATYNWTGPNSFASTLQNPAVGATLASAGTYKVAVTVGGCTSDQASKTIVVNQTPNAFVVTPAVSSVCAGSAATLLTAGNSGTLLSENFEGAVNWTNVNNSTGSYPFQADWMAMPSGVFYTNKYFSSNDGSTFYISKSIEHAIFGETHTQLVSQSFSTMGYSTLTVSYYHYYEQYPPSTAIVDFSTDSISWTTVKSYAATTGTSNQFAHELITLPAAFAGKPNVYMRFKYDAPNGDYWSVDNISIIGSNSASVVWSPVTGLYTDAAAQNAYAGTARTNVYVKRATAGIYTYIGTATSNSCSFSDTAAITVKPATDQGYYFRSIATGNWNDAAIWEASPDNVTFFASCVAPGANATSITIRSPHIVTVTASLAAAKSTVQNGATLKVNNGVVLTTK